MDLSGRDHALGAQHYLMLYAETLGLGTCINGYAQSALLGLLNWLYALGVVLVSVRQLQ
jgi:hypothetical protein